MTHANVNLVQGDSNGMKTCRGPRNIRSSGMHLSLFMVHGLRYISCGLDLLASTALCSGASGLTEHGVKLDV